MTAWLLLPTALAYTFHVPGDGSLEEALFNLDVDQIAIDEGLDLSLEEPFTIDRPLIIEGADGVVLPPFGVNGVEVQVRRVTVSGETQFYAAGATGDWVECVEAPCTIMQVGGQLTLEDVVIEDTGSAHAIYTRDGDLHLREVDVHDCVGVDYVILVESSSVPVTATVDALSFSGNNGPVKFYDSGGVGMDVTVEASSFSANTAWIAPDLYLWGVDGFTISNVVFKGSQALSPERGALHLTDSSGVVSAVEFTDGPGMTAIAEYDGSSVEIYGITCSNTYSEGSGGCLYASGLDDLRVLNMWAIGSSSEGWGGAVYAEGDGGALRLEQLNLIGTTASGNGGGVAIDNLKTVVLDARFCGTSGGEGSALYFEDGRLDLNQSAFQGSMGGAALFLQNAPLNAGNLTFIGGEEAFIDGRPNQSNWHISNSLFMGDQRVTSQGQGPTMELSYNLFWDGATSSLDHSEGLIEADPLFTDKDLYDCYTELRPALDSPAVDGNPTDTEPDGTGVRDLGWYWGQEATESSDPDTDSGSDDTGLQKGYTLVGASGGCATGGGASTLALGLLGLLLGTIRRG